jgi:hypothetical protein
MKRGVVHCRQVSSDRLAATPSRRTGEEALKLLCNQVFERMPQTVIAVEKLSPVVKPFFLRVFGIEEAGRPKVSDDFISGIQHRTYETFVIDGHARITSVLSR